MSDSRAALNAFIVRVRRRWFAQVLLRTIGLAATGAAAPILASLVVTRLLRLEGRPLVLLAFVTLLLSLGAVAFVVLRMQRRPDDRRVARFIEERATTTGAQPMDDALVSAVEVTSSVGNASSGTTPHGRARFDDLIVAAAVKRLNDLTPQQVLPRQDLGRGALQGLAGAALLAAVLVPSTGPLREAVETAWVTFYPRSIRVEVSPGDARVVAGTPLRIHAVVKARRGSLKRLTPSLTVSAGAEQRSVAMTPRGDGFDFGFESVDRTFRYKVAAGSHTSREYTITALLPPRVRRIDVRYEYPSFTGLPPRDEKDAGDLYAPAGTRVRVQVHTDKPIASGEMALGSNTRIPMTPAGETTLETHLLLSKDDSYRLRLADRDGLHSNGDTEYFIRLMDDRPPDVRILRPSGDQQITPLEEVAIEARADDDYGIASLELVYSVAGRSERVVPFGRVTGTQVAKIGSHLLPAEDLAVQPGDVITYYARARDIGRGKRPTETRSDIFFLEVRPFNEEFTAAQSQAMSGAGDPQIESLIAAQKEIITATWNIERRAAAGRSADDVKSVAQAQAELKARAERIIGRGRLRPQGPFPQQTIPFGQQRVRQSNPDSVSAAIEAMSRAVQQLEGEKTKEAIPHEMAALQGLLQAQAEVRRRQVSQQASGASNGGAGRQGQDLSALFDKELQRQQRTNYETRSQVEERPDQPDDQSALDRIRDLARHQEDLSRRLRDLTQSGLSPEEIKRQLEKLTREQIELREQAEELARQSGSQQLPQQQRPSSQQSGNSGHQNQSSQAQSPSQTRNPGQQSGRGGAEMRDASEQMRNAANDLRRDNPNAAADSASRAAEQLRRAEQQIRGGSAEARQRAAGELQMEAQQIAEAQRRIASETERLAKEGTTNADALRRLAGEKQDLAHRVDALERAARDLAKQSGTAGAKDAGAAGAVAEGARELGREQIGRRMRDSANEMSQASRSRTTHGVDAADRSRDAARAQTEQQIARTLDKVVERMGGAANADARKLSEQLDESRGIRDRLNRLEQQIRDAEGRPPSARSSREATPGSDGKQGERGRQGSTGSGSGGELERLREEYARELQRARDTLSRLQQSAPRDGVGGSTPEQHEYSLSAPGNESFKQDFSKWGSLKKDIDQALERYETAVSQRLSKKLAEDRLSAGGSERVPDAYSRLIARYYESLAKTRK
jgi:hypothetical protein